MNTEESGEPRKKSKTELLEEITKKQEKQRKVLYEREDLALKEGWILRFLERIDWFSNKYLNLLTLITRCKPQWYGSYSLSENFVLICFASEFVFFLLLLFFPWLSSHGCFTWSVKILLSYRLINMVIYWFHAHMLYRQVISPLRSLVLAAINFFEVTIIFAILDFFARNSFSVAFESIQQSLYYSFRVITTIGSDINPSNICGYLLFYSQIIIGIGLLVVVVSLIISYFPSGKKRP